MCDCSEESSSLPIGPEGPAGANGTNGNNGTNGTDGISYAIQNTDIPSGGSVCNCNGGVQVDIGPDLNNDGIPDFITQTFILCNGCDGLDAFAPIGLITMFDGDCSLPGPNFDVTGLGIGDLENYAMCNGANSTPDLRGQFIVGLYPGGDSDGDYGNIGDTGGEKFHTLVTGELASHTHGPGTLATNTTGNHSHNVNVLTQVPVGTGTWGDNSNDESLLSATTSTNGNHSHSVTSGVTGSSGSGSPHENRPPFYVLSYIKRIS